MALQVNDVVLVTYRMSWEQQRYLSTWTYRVNSNSAPDTTPNETFNIATHFATPGANEPMTRVAAIVPNNVAISEVRAQKVNAPREVYRSATPGIAVGTFSVPANTGNLAAVGTYTTAFAGRSETANKHIGPVGGIAIVDGGPSAGLAAAMENIMSEMRNPQGVVSNGGVIELLCCIFHRSSNTSSDVIAHRVSDRIGTMRRRTLRVGE